MAAKRNVSGGVNVKQGRGVVKAKTPMVALSNGEQVPQVWLDNFIVGWNVQNRREANKFAADPVYKGRTKAVAEGKLAYEHGVNARSKWSDELDFGGDDYRQAA